MQKQFISGDELQQSAFELSLQIVQSGFEPSHILVVWRGGASIGITVHEVLSVCGVQTEHAAVRVASYSAIEKRDNQIRIQDITAFAKALEPQHQLLIVDDIHDTGLSMQALIKYLQKCCGKNLPDTIKIATLFYKPTNSQVEFIPDFYLQKSDRWLVFPHELQGLSNIELAEHKPHIATVKAQLLARLNRSV